MAMPLIGPKVQTQVPETIKDFIGRLAVEHGVKEAVVVRELIMVGAERFHQISQRVESALAERV